MSVNLSIVNDFGLVFTGKPIRIKIMRVVPNSEPIAGQLLWICVGVRRGESHLCQVVELHVLRARIPFRHIPVCSTTGFRGRLGQYMVLPYTVAKIRIL